MSNRFKLKLVTFVIAVVATSSVIAQPKPDQVTLQSESTEFDFFSDALTIIQTNHISRPTMTQLVKPCLPVEAGPLDRLSNLQGLDQLREHLRSIKIQDLKQVLRDCLKQSVRALGPYNDLLDSAIFETSENLPAGVGVNLQIKDEQIVIVQTIDGAPAEDANLRANDVIQSIDGQTLNGQSLIEVVKRLRGAVGSTVALTILRNGSSQPIEVKITRKRVTQNRFILKSMSDEILYLAVHSFQESTVREIRNLLRKMRSESKTPSAGLILDLRNCSGGLFDATLNLAALFLPRDAQLSKQQDYASKIEILNFESSRQRFRDWVALDAPQNLEFQSIPIVVIVSARTSSGAEIVAAALQDNRRATILGEKTFGKGSIETILRTKQADLALQLTTTQTLRLDQSLLEGNGITPDDGFAVQHWAGTLPPNNKAVDVSDPIIARSLVLLKQKAKPKSD